MLVRTAHPVGAGVVASSAAAAIPGVTSDPATDPATGPATGPADARHTTGEAVAQQGRAVEEWAAGEGARQQTGTEQSAGEQAAMPDGAGGPPPVAPDAAAFDAAIAGQVPPYGQRGNKTSGVAVMDDGTQIPLDSGYNTGRSGELPKPRPGMNGNNLSNVEAHTAAEMRLRGIQEATLYINRVPCPGRNGCENLLPRMVPPGGKLTIYGPDGFLRVVYGAPG